MTTDEMFKVARTHHQAGRLAEAERIYRDILAQQPDHAFVLEMLGVLAQQCGQPAAGAELIQRAIAINPRVASFHNNLGEARRLMDRPDLAVASYQRALALEGLPQARYNLARALAQLGQVCEAEQAYVAALRVAPDAKAATNLGVLLAEQGRLLEAIKWMQSAVSIAPESAEAWGNLGAALGHTNAIDQALAAARRGVELNSASASCRNSYAIVLQRAGLVAEAMASFREAARVSPKSAAIASNVLYVGQFHGEMPAAENFAAHRQWAAAHAEPLTAAAPPHPAGGRDSNKRLRIGYVSADTFDHPVSRFFLPMLMAHDRARFHITCYANTYKADAVTHALRDGSDQWREVAAVSDAAMAEMIRRDEIDILVDLAGHTADNRLPAFARRPAPVQVTYLGYPDTTAMSAMDWRITDALADPPGLTDQWHTERLMRLERCAWCYLPPRDAPPVIARKSGAGTRFGSFNNVAKISPATITLWTKLLQAVPDARLVLKSTTMHGNAVRQRLYGAFADAGIQPQRLELLSPLESTAAHLATYGSIDVALDTFPYAGTTTTCEALWMGVPVVTLAGERHVSRVGASLLSAVCLDDLVAKLPDEYVDFVRRLAGDAERLNHLRSNLRDTMRGSPLLDASGFARRLEAAYRTMWITPPHTPAPEC